MILSDYEIECELHRGRLGIEGMSDPSLQIQPASVDLCLGNSFCLSRSNGMLIRPGDDLATMFWAEETRELVTIEPGQFMLATTVERVRLPYDLVGRVDGRSSIGRLGLAVHTTAGFIDPGFRGQITLELSNVGHRPIELKPGLRICQLSFHRMSSPAMRPYGHPSRGSSYQGQQGATASRLKA